MLNYQRVSITIICGCHLCHWEASRYVKIKALKLGEENHH